MQNSSQYENLKNIEGLSGKINDLYIDGDSQVNQDQLKELIEDYLDIEEFDEEELIQLINDFYEEDYGQKTEDELAETIEEYVDENENNHNSN